MFKNKSLYVNGVANDHHQNNSMRVHTLKMQQNHEDEVF